MPKIVTIVGARPQFIKLAMVSREIQETSPFKEVLIHTGQHYDIQMSDIFFKDLNLPRPKYYLGVGSYHHGKQTGLMLQRIETILIKEKPNLVMIYGDTNSTLAGALAASKLHIPVAHVEAGMRSFNKTMPEEMNRIVVDHLSDILFCSSLTAVKNLKKEGIYSQKKGFPSVVNVGDVMLDSFRFFYKISRKKSKILKELNLKPKSYFLATIHRAENTDHREKLEILFKMFNEITSVGYKIIMPLHPRTSKAIQKLNLKNFSNSFQVNKPISYLDMLKLEKNALGIMTDSGGIQKEAYFLGIPTMTLRDQTEWVETVESGLNCLTPIKEQAIRRNFLEILKSKRKSTYLPCYGKGDAARHIVAFIKKTITNDIQK